MNKFNLTFSGEISAGHDPAQVRSRFGKLYSIDDPDKLERFFSGETVILRRNMERKEAARCYHELHLLGAVAALVKVTTADTVNALVNGQDGGPAHLQPTTKMATSGRRSAATQAAKTKTLARSTGKKTVRISVASPASASGKRVTQPSTKGAKLPAASKPRDGVDIAAAIKARKLASQRAATELAARQKAALAEQQLRAEQEAARLAEEAAAQRAAQEAEARRQAAEEEARRATELAAARQREAEEAARKAAEQVAIQQRKTEETARKAAEQAAIKQRKAEEAARTKAAKAEARRKAAELEAQRKREKAAQARRRAAERQARESAAQAEQIKQEAQQQQAQGQRQSTERRRANGQALAERQDPRREPPLSGNAPVVSTLPSPQRGIGQSGEAATVALRKRQPGEPNLYQLHPFRANQEVRSRAARAQQLRRRSYTIGLIASAALLLALGNFLQRATEPLIGGARAAATVPHEGPVLLVGDTLLFHDRAGNSTRAATLGELQVAALEAPLVFDSEGALYARGRLAGDASNESLRLLRCDAPVAACREFSAELNSHNVDTFVLNPVDGSVLVADVQAGQLLKTDRDGKLLASAAVTLPSRPVLRLHGGLLLINSAAAPALSVLRYENKAFGQQLDEILLLPPSASDAEQLRVANFLWSGDAWWASLRNLESGDERLYRFDDEWNYTGEVTLPHLNDSLQLTAWGAKTLVSDTQHVAMERFNAQGSAEAQFVSSSLDTMTTAQQRRLGLSRTAWHSGLLLCALSAALGLGLGYLNTLRAQVYNARRESGAEPIDGYANSLHWIDPAKQRVALLRRRTVGYCLFAIGALWLAIALSVTTTQLAALLIALSGPLLALSWLGRKPIGHLGVLEQRLVLVDHNGMYHIAGGSRIQHCGPFLCIDDVLVCSGTRMFPAFAQAQVQQQVKPLALGGIKVDYRTVLVKLIESRHPLAIAALALVGSLITATLLLSF